MVRRSEGQKDGRTDVNKYIPTFSKRGKKVELWFLLPAYCLRKLYICTNFHENIDDRFKVI